MVKPEILQKQPLSLSAVKKELASIKKRDGELSFRAQKVEEYVNDFAVLSSKDANELQGKIEALAIARMKPEMVQKIVDTLPSTLAQAKVVLQGYSLSVTNENLKRIADACAEYSKK